jgi:hypothetical protein
MTKTTRKKSTFNFPCHPNKSTCLVKKNCELFSLAENCNTWGTLLKKLSKDKQSSLFGLIVRDENKRFAALTPGYLHYKTFLGIIYVTSTVFPYDFDCTLIAT